MKLQKATQCALFAVIELARNPERQISAADIANKFGISANHLAKVLRDLARARLVESMRGAGGGYRFSGNAKRLTLYEIVSLFEDIDAHDSGFPETNEPADIGRALNKVMSEIEGIAVSTLKSITLTTLLKIMGSQSAHSNED